jgi:hypothetical protein
MKRIVPECRQIIMDNGQLSMKKKEQRLFSPVQRQAADGLA